MRQHETPAARKAFVEDYLIRDIGHDATGIMGAYIMQDVRSELAREPLNDRYATLDGARGIAAVLVVLFHLGRTYGILTPESAYLAVDMFFALSGFVLAKTNDGRLAGTLSPYQFMERRAVRLLPLYVVGLLLGLVVLVLSWREGGLSTTALIGSAIFGAVLLPLPVHIKPPRLFPANGPSWTLFCEFWVANLIYAIFWRRLHGRTLAAVIGLSGLVLAVLAVRHHGLDQGSLRGNVIGGIARVLFSFFAGVALRRFHRSRPAMLAMPGWLVLLILTAILCVPVPLEVRAVFDIVAVIAVFPCLILAGANAKERRPDVGIWIGDLSYAVYVTHIPMLDLWKRWWPSLPGSDGYLATVCFMVLALTAAALLHKFYDEPVRSKLSSYLKTRRARQQS